MQPVKMAIIGAGNIAHTMAKTLVEMSGIVAYAIASRDLERAEVFGKQYGFEKVYGSYEEMLADPAVELVYIATPHSHHAEHAALCLNAGKHILVEKAFTVNAAQARKVLALAREKQLLAAEAIWPRYMPMAKTIRDFCDSEKIGKITGLTANLGYPVWGKERIHQPHLAGGALLDIGIYPLTFASILFGDDVTDIATTAQMGDTGVDVCETITLTYRDGRMASLYVSAVSPSDRRGMICGESGYAVVENINNFESLTVYDRDHTEVEKIVRPEQITGFEYEVTAAVEAIRSGSCQCPQMPHERIISMMEQMDRIREIWGLRYPME